VRALPVLLAIPLLAVPMIAYLLLSGGNGGGPALAQGSVGGVFHPIAGNFEPDETQLDGCDGRYGCLEQAFGNLAFRQGPKAALALFEERMTTDPVVEKDCHRIVHTIGSAALERFDGSVAKTFSLGSPSCVSGYYHGILERAFLGVSSKAKLGEVARSLCLGGGMRRRGFLDYQCRHGLGHGLMIQTGSTCLWPFPSALGSAWVGIAGRARGVRSWRTSTHASASARRGWTTRIRSTRVSGFHPVTGALATCARAGGS
jgi:hypothetical protein